MAPLCMLMLSLALLPPLAAPLLLAADLAVIAQVSPEMKALYIIYIYTYNISAETPSILNPQVVLVW